MHITAADETIAAALLIIDRAQTRCGTTKVVAVDGPSGAGKTDFAAALADRLASPQLLHMDDLYPGWDGLRQAVPARVEVIHVQELRTRQAVGQGSGEVGLASTAGPVHCDDFRCAAARLGSVNDQQSRGYRLVRRRDVHVWTLERPDPAVNAR